MGIDVTVFYIVTDICMEIRSLPLVLSHVLRDVFLFQQVNKPRFTEQIDVTVTYIWECSLRNRLCLSRRRYCNRF
jgi:hypothetical protein